MRFRSLAISCRIISDYTRENIAEAVREATDGEGADVVCEIVAWDRYPLPGPEKNQNLSVGGGRRSCHRLSPSFLTGDSDKWVRRKTVRPIQARTTMAIANVTTNRAKLPHSPRTGTLWRSTH